MLLGLFQRLFHMSIQFMTQKIHKEIIFPFSLLIRTRTNIGHINIIVLEHIQHIHQCPRPVSRTEQDNSLDIAGRFGILRVR